MRLRQFRERYDRDFHNFNYVQQHGIQPSVRISGIHIQGEEGGNNVVEDSGVTQPLWFYGGEGSDTMTGEKSGDTVVDVGGDGQPEIRADGPPTIPEGEPATLALSSATGDASIADWNIDWDDGSYDTVTTTTPSHTYTSGTGVYTVFVTADDSAGRHGDVS